MTREEAATMMDEVVRMELMARTLARAVATSDVPGDDRWVYWVIERGNYEMARDMLRTKEAK